MAAAPVLLLRILIPSVHILIFGNPMREKLGYFSERSMAFVLSELKRLSKTAQ